MVQYPWAPPTHPASQLTTHHTTPTHPCPQAAWAATAKLWAVVASLVQRLPWPHIHDSEKGLLQAMQLLLASVFAVPLICKLPGGSPVLGFLVGWGLGLG